MIYQTPTLSPTRYDGKYPSRIRTVSASQGLVWVELFSGTRYVARNAEFTDLPRYGRSFENYLRNPGAKPVQMTARMYERFRYASDRAACIRRYDDVFGTSVI